MKSAFLLAVVLALITSFFACGQPNTTTTFELGIVNPQAEKYYRYFIEEAIDTTLATRLNDGMDFLAPDDVTDLEVFPTNFVMVGDTSIGELEYPDVTPETWLRFGLVQVDSGTNKYSAMGVYPMWVNIDTIEVLGAEFFIRRKD